MMVYGISLRFRSIMLLARGGNMSMRAHGTWIKLACLWAAWWFSGVPAIGQQTPDHDFKVTVANSAYKDLHPKVLFDEAHFNVHTTQRSYKTFVDLVTRDGYQVTANAKPFEGKVLAGYDILVISIARGAPRRSEKPAFTDAECDVVKDWVEGGGSLLLVTDHYPSGYGAENLGNRFGIKMSKGTTSDTKLSPSGRAGGILIFSREKDAIGEHPITGGRNKSERINRVATFTGQSLKGPKDSVALLKFSDTAVDRLYRHAAGNVANRRPERSDDVPTVSAAGRSQALAFHFGKGRVVVLGEASHISAQQPNRGFDYPDCDNRQWTLNIMHWLSGLLDEPVPK